MAAVIGSSPRPALVPPQPCGVDVYIGDRACDWSAYIAAGWPWCMACFKLTEGLDYEYSIWAERQRALFIASSRFGIDLFDSFYHFLTLHQDGAPQADRFCQFMQKIGGEKKGTLPAMLDVERGGQRIQDPSRQLVIDRVNAFSLRYKQLTGREATLYATELPRSLGIRDRMGCGRSAVAAYGTELRRYNHQAKAYVGTTQEFLAEVGTDLQHSMLWQYRGTDPQAVGPKDYPMSAPGCGPLDIYAVILPGGLPAVQALSIGVA